MKLSESELAELLSKNPSLKLKVAEMALKPQRKASEFVPILGNEQRVKEMLEDAIQATYFEWVLNPDNIALMPELDVIYSIPNGANKSKFQRGIFRATGLRSGVPDVHIPISRKPFFSFYIEFKRYEAFRRKNHDCTALQLLWHEKLRSFGHKVVVIWHPLEAIRQTKEYLGY